MEDNTQITKGIDDIIQVRVAEEIHGILNKAGLKLHPFIDYTPSGITAMVALIPINDESGDGAEPITDTAAE